MPMRERASGRQRAGVAVLMLLVLALAAPLGSAAAAEPELAFCEGKTLHDYLAPFKRMPKLHAPPESGRLGFGPSNLRFSFHQPMLVGGGAPGFDLSLFKRSPAVHPRWEMTAMLSQVDWKGRVRKVVDEARRKVITVNRERGAGVDFEVGSAPGVYRLTVVFRSRTGQKLGGFGAYYRVTPVTQHARLGLDADSYHAEGTLLARVEDFGTTVVAYGVPYVIERFDGESWTEAPESPKGPWIMPLLFSFPGTSGPCSGFQIPASMPPGLYRMKKEVEFVFPHLTHRRGGHIDYPRHKRFLTAEFEVVP